MTPAAWSAYRRGACLPGSRCYRAMADAVRLHVGRVLVDLSDSALMAAGQIDEFSRAWHDSVVREAAAQPAPDLYRRRLAGLSREAS